MIDKQISVNNLKWGSFNINSNERRSSFFYAHRIVIIILLGIIIMYGRVDSCVSKAHRAIGLSGEMNVYSTEMCNEV